MTDRPTREPWPTDVQRDRIAKALYVVAGGNEESFPWPCKRADYYRKLADAAMKAWWSK